MLKNTERVLGLLSLTPCTINEMARRLTVSRNTLASTVNRMCANGLVQIIDCVRGHYGHPSYRYGLRK